MTEKYSDILLNFDYFMEDGHLNGHPLFKKSLKVPKIGLYIWCDRGDLNSHTRRALPPQGSVSTVPPRSHLEVKAPNGAL